jgi:type IV pilus assembly protein PilC
MRLGFLKAKSKATPAAAAKPAAQKRVNHHFAFKEREYFVENLALLLKAAVPIGQALMSLEHTSRNRQMKQVLKQMQADIDAGVSLADALERGGIVSSQTLALVHLGEQSGHLVENMQLSAEQEEKRHYFRSKVRSALIYPAFVLSLTMIVGLGVAWFLLPRLAATFDQLQVALPAISKYMINFGLFLKEHGFIAVPAIVVFFGIVGYILFAAPKTKFIGQRMLSFVPGISRLMQEVEVAQFGYLLGTLLDAGLPITKALHLLADSSSSRQHKQLYEYLASSLEDGQSFQQALSSYKNISKLLPPSVQQMIIAGESSGSLADVLKTIGRTFEQKSDVTTQNLQSILEPILLIIVWIGVMAVAVAVILPIYSLVGGLN